MPRRRALRNVAGLLLGGECALASRMAVGGESGGAGVSKTGFVYDEIYLRHETPKGFPESPKRLTSIVDRLKSEKLFDRLVQPKPLTKGLTGWIAGVHDADYIEHIAEACAKGATYVDSYDAPICRQSNAAALAAVGGALAAVDAVVAGPLRNAFCAVRPPGHHALRRRAMGFCLFNNIAIAARYAQQKHKLEKVLIVDWDVHHGNGTQEAFYEDPSVLFFSIHQHPFFPGTGSAKERGKGPGLGFNINVPRPAGTGDREYEKVFNNVLLPAALKFKPDLVLISAGFDAHRDDPLGGMAVTTRGFEKLTRLVRTIAQDCCQDRIVSLLEGGYDLTGLSLSVATHLRTLMA